MFRCTASRHKSPLNPRVHFQAGRMQTCIFSDSPTVTVHFNQLQNQFNEYGTPSRGFRITRPEPVFMSGDRSYTERARQTNFIDWKNNVWIKLQCDTCTADVYVYVCMHAYTFVYYCAKNVEPQFPPAKHYVDYVASAFR